MKIYCVTPCLKAEKYIEETIPDVSPDRVIPDLCMRQAIPNFIKALVPFAKILTDDKLDTSNVAQICSERPPSAFLAGIEGLNYIIVKYVNPISHDSLPQKGAFIFHTRFSVSLPGESVIIDHNSCSLLMKR